MRIVAGYAALAGSGVPVEPTLVESINGGDMSTTLSDAPNAEPSPLFGEATLAQLRSMLKGVTSYGTAASAFVIAAS